MSNKLAKENQLTEKFECDICEKRFRKSYKLREHELIHKGEKPFLCYICGKDFPRKYKLYNHERSHLRKTLFKCNICRKGFTRRYFLEKHEKNHREAKTFGCSICGKHFAMYYQLRLHRMMHIGGKTYKYSNHNVKSTADWTKTVITDKEISRCSNAEIEVIEIPEMNSTFLAETSIDDCIICIESDDDDDVIFIDEIRHDEEYILGLPSSQTSSKIENLQTSSNRNLESILDDDDVVIVDEIRHNDEYIMRLPSSRTPNETENPQISSNTNQKSLLESEIEKRLFEFNICNRNPVFESLKKQLLTYSNENPYKCAKCDKVFLIPSQLKVHEIFHFISKSFKCDAWEKMFSSASRQKRNKQIHSKQIPFKCKCLTFEVKICT